MAARLREATSSTGRTSTAAEAEALMDEVMDGRLG